MKFTSLYLSVFAVVLKCSYGYFITVDAHAEECFFERVEKEGTKLGLMFETSDGGFLDIDVKIVGPNGVVIHEGERESSGKYTFSAHEPGVYTYCFGNQMSTMTPKVVMFNMEVGEPMAAKSEDGDHNNLETMIKELTAGLTSVKHEQEYMAVRDRTHHGINEATNSRVVLWSTFEAIVLIAMTVGQVFYLKRFFEVRRVI